MNKVCITCSKPFVHVQEGRGRPPKRCHACRKAGINIDRSAVLLEHPRRVLRPGTPKVGDKVVHIGIDPNYATPVKILSIEGEDAFVDYGGEVTQTRYSKLSLFGRG